MMYEKSQYNEYQVGVRHKSYNAFCPSDDWYEIIVLIWKVNKKYAISLITYL